MKEFKTIGQLLLVALMLVAIGCSSDDKKAKEYNNCEFDLEKTKTGSLIPAFVADKAACNAAFSSTKDNAGKMPKKAKFVIEDVKIVDATKKLQLTLFKDLMFTITPTAGKADAKAKHTAELMLGDGADNKKSVEVEAAANGVYGSDSEANKAKGLGSISAGYCIMLDVSAANAVSKLYNNKGCTGKAVDVKLKTVLAETDTKLEIADADSNGLDKKAKITVSTEKAAKK